jgi:citrate synthase
MAGMTRDKGLQDVVAAETELADIDGVKGTLRYCGYKIADLARDAEFEEILALLWDGDLPARGALASLKQALRVERGLSSQTLKLLETLPTTAVPMSALRTTVSALADETDRSNDARAICLRLTAQIPAITAAFGRLRQGKASVPPRDDLGHAANLLWMYHAREPRDVEVAALNAYMVLLAEHSLNASTFAARVVIGAGGDVYGAVTAAIAALHGRIHGGANQEAYEMMEAIGDPELVTAYIEESLRLKRRIMGIGHRIYQVEDPRVQPLQAHAERLVASGADGTILRIAAALRDVVRQHPYFVERRLAPNVEFYSAPLLGALGFPADMFPALFACSRIVGWSAHLVEQWRDNRLIRPKAHYSGVPARAFRRLEERG